MLINLLEPDGYSRDAVELYEKLGTIVTGKRKEDEKRKVSVLVVRLAHLMDASFLAPYSSLKAIASPTTGLNHIDTEHCKTRNIRIFSLQQHCDAIDKITSTSELTMGLILGLLRRIPAAHDDVVHGQQWRRDPFKTRQLSTLTIGLVGLGRIGGHVATYARTFGMRVIAYDPYIINTHFSRMSAEKVELETLCGQSDIVSIHANQRDDNYHLVGKREIQLMKSDALIVNTARGTLIYEQAAAIALRDNCLGGIACDVLETELEQNFLALSPLVKAAEDRLNVILTPHIGGCTSDAMHITEELLAKAVYSALGPGDD